MKTALYFGSFNPPHCGHAAIARYLREQAGFMDVRIVLSPQNPLKDKKLLLSDAERIAMVKAWTDAVPYLSLCTLEFEMERPSYTYLTLRRLRLQEAETEFVLVMGADSLSNFPRWRAFDEIVREHELCVYPRDGYDMQAACSALRKLLPDARVRLLDAPVFPYSSTEIRRMRQAREDISGKVPAEVLDYIQKHDLYR